MRAHNPSPETDDELPDETGFEPDVIYLSPDEWMVLFERDVRDAFGVSAAEFVRRYRAGEYDDSDPDVMLLSVSIAMYDAILAA
ncbi:MAG: hypothetical protein ACTHQE_00325 [Thermomicrobiales bacterium]